VEGPSQIRLLGLGGSLRERSCNRALPDEAARMAASTGAELDPTKRRASSSALSASTSPSTARTCRAPDPDDYDRSMVEEGKPAPEFSLTSDSGKQISL
jgi:hypothetical protein